MRYGNIVADSRASKLKLRSDECGRERHHPHFNLVHEMLTVFSEELKT
jgi:hypothetical protein